MKVTQTMWQHVEPWPEEVTHQDTPIDVPVAVGKRGRIVAFVKKYGPCTAKHVADRMFLNSATVSATLGQAVREGEVTCEKRQVSGKSQRINFYSGVI